MSMLAALVRAYDRLPDAPPFGYSSEKIGFCVVLNPDGSVDEVIDLRGTDKKQSSKPLMVPAPFKRPGVTPRPLFLWDNANYALGIAEIENSNDLRFKAFKEKHLQLLASESDQELVAFRNFLDTWIPAKITNFVKIEDIAPLKVIFAHRETYKDHYLHANARAKALWIESSDVWRAVEGKRTTTAVCLVKGQRLPVARTHPAIKGIPSKSGKDADTLIGFNLDAFTSYGHEQGDNAPISEAAAFAYTTALNRFLADKDHRLQIGDASTVFWADAADAAVVREADQWAAVMFGSSFASGAEEDIAAARIRDKLLAIRDGNPARRLGRLFALIEKAQLAALGDRINATVRDKFLGAAAAAPGRVMSTLVINAERHHLKRLRNGHSDADWITSAEQAQRVGAALSRRIGELWAGLGKAAKMQHSSEEQGLFMVGYYQERYAKRTGEPDAQSDEPEAAAPETETEE